MSRKNNYQLKLDKLYNNYEYNGQCISKEYEIRSDIYYPGDRYNGEGIRMYDENMTWCPEFSELAPLLLLKPIQSSPPTCLVAGEDVPCQPSILSGTPLPDALTGSTFMLFKPNGEGPVKNDANKPALLVNMYQNTPDLRFSYTVVPTDASKPVKVSFYSMVDMYGFIEERFWLMLDRDAHFTTYNKVSHIFTIPAVLSWISIVENVSSMNLTIEAVPVELFPPVCCPYIMANVYIGREKQTVIVAEVNEASNNNLSIKYEPDLLYSVRKMRSYVQDNSKSLLLPLIPAGIDPEYTELVPYIKTDLGVYFNIDNAIKNGDKTLHNDATDRWSFYDGTSGHWGINTTDLALNSKAISVSWMMNIRVNNQITMLPKDQQNITVTLKHYHYGQWVVLDKVDAEGDLVRVNGAFIEFTYEKINSIDISGTLFIPKTTSDVILHIEPLTARTIYRDRVNVIDSVTFSSITITPIPPT